MTNQPDSLLKPDIDLPLELVPRNCTTQHYTPMEVPAFEIDGEFIAYASPEATYGVTKQLIGTARRSILIGIYDFTAEYMRDLLLDAIRNRVKVSIMLDLDRLRGETELYEQIVRAGGEGVPAPSCASRHARFFPSCHEKVIVIDDEWTMVQSGNYTEASIPKNTLINGGSDDFTPGSRDMGIAVRSEALAAFFTRVIRSDMKLELDASIEEGMERELPPIDVELEVPRPRRMPVRLFPSRHYRPRNSVKVQPVLSPDNYMQVIPEFLSSARQSIYLEQQYIRAHQPHIQRLLEAIAGAKKRNPYLRVRIVLARPIGRQRERVDELLADLKEYGLEPGTNIRFLNPSYFVHCHNKLIVVDQQSVLVSSQNWSDFAVSANREAGLILHAPPLARYYARIFQSDWDTGLQSLESPAQPEADMEELPGEAVEWMRVNPGDFIEV